MRRAEQQAQHHDLVILGTRDHARLVLILIVVTVEECQLLLAMSWIVVRVDVKGEACRWRIERGDELVDEHVLQTPQHGNGDCVLKARQRRLAGQIIRVRRPTGNQLEHRIAAEHVVVVLILVVGEDPEYPRTQHLVESMLNPRGVAAILQSVAHCFGKADHLVELPDRQQAGVTGQLSLHRFDDDGFLREHSEGMLPSVVRNHSSLRVFSQGAVLSTP